MHLPPLVFSHLSSPSGYCLAFFSETGFNPLTYTGLSFVGLTPQAYPFRTTIVRYSLSPTQPPRAPARNIYFIVPALARMTRMSVPRLFVPVFGGLLVSVFDK